jgi:hypothetical protein
VDQAVSPGECLRQNLTSALGFRARSWLVWRGHWILWSGRTWSDHLHEKRRVGLMFIGKFGGQLVWVIVMLAEMLEALGPLIFASVSCFTEFCRPSGV